MWKYKVLQTGQFRVVGLQSFNSLTKLHAQKLELRLLFSHPEFLQCILSLVSV